MLLKPLMILAIYTAGLLLTGLLLNWLDDRDGCDDPEPVAGCLVVLWPVALPMILLAMAWAAVVRAARGRRG